MELNVGDYVRTKKRGFQKPQIAKIINISKDEGYKNQNYITLDHNLIPDYEFHIYEADIAKSSPNIIDLIEVGDYVNGYRISYSGGFYQYWDDMFDKNTIETDKDIKSVLTHEQFEAMQYVVGDN